MVKTCHLLSFSSLVYYNTLDTDLLFKWDLHETAQKVIIYGEFLSHENFIVCTGQDFFLMNNIIINEEYHQGPNF